MADVVGAPLPEQTTDYKPMLDGKGESIIVAVHNPLTADFRVQYARSVIQGGAPSKEQQFAREKAGLDLTKEQNPQAHATKYLVLKAGETINLPGDIAQIAVRQLVNYIIQTRHKGTTSMPLADGFARNRVEQEIIVSISDNMTFFNQPSADERTEKQLEELNPPTKPADATNPPPGQGMTYVPGQTSPKATS